MFRASLRVKLLAAPAAPAGVTPVIPSCLRASGEICLGAAELNWPVVSRLMVFSAPIGDQIEAEGGARGAVQFGELHAQHHLLLRRRQDPLADC